MINSDSVSIAVSGEITSPQLKLFVERQAALMSSPADSDLLIKDSPAGIILYWRRGQQKELEFFIDIDKFCRQQKTFPAPKHAGLSQAIGRKTKHVIDATAGWGSDALLLCAQGYRVTLVERSPLMALMLTDAMFRLSNTSWARQHAVAIPRVIEADAIKLLGSRKLTAECVYLDPMFPAKRKKSAAANKNMQLLQWLVGADQDAGQLVSVCIAAGYPRIVVKRPNYAAPLRSNPSTTFAGKLVHYDVYLNPARRPGE